MNIDVINRELIDDLGATDYQDLVNFSSAGGSTQGEENLEREFTFRGLNSRFSKLNTFIWYNPVDQYVIERVEVVKGPSALLYGEGEPSGTVNVSTKQALFGGNIYDFGTRFNDNGEVRLTVDVNQELIDDRVAIRVAALETESDSWRVNQSRDQQGFYANAGIKLMSWATLRLSYLWDHRKDISPTPILRLAGSTLTESDISQIPGLTVDNSQSWGGLDNGMDREYDVYTAFLDLQPAQWVSISLGYNVQDQTTLQSGYDGDGDLRNVGDTVFGSTNPFDEYAVAHRPLDGWSSNLVETFIATVVFDFETGPVLNKIVLGYQDETDGFQLEQRQLKDENNQRPVAWVPLSAGPEFIAVAADDPRYTLRKAFSIDQAGDVGGRETTSYYVAYQGFMLDNRVRVFAGARNDDFYKTGMIGFAGLDSVFRNQGEDAFDVDSYNYGFVAALDSEKLYNFYYNHAESFRPAGSFRVDPFGNGLAPSIGEGDEIGLKFQSPNGKISGVFSIYDIKFGGTDVNAGSSRDFWDPDRVAAGNFTTAPTESKGWELQFVANPNPNWTLTFAYGTSNPKSAGAIMMPIVRDDGNGNAEDTGEVYIIQESGSPLDRVDEDIINMATRYKFDEGGLAGFTVGGNLQMRMNRRGAVSSVGDVTYFGDYTTIGLFVRYKTNLGEKATWTSTVNLSNVLDDRDMLGTLSAARWSNPRGISWSNSIRF